MELNTKKKERERLKERKTLLWLIVHGDTGHHGERADSRNVRGLPQLPGSTMDRK